MNTIRFSERFEAMFPPARHATPSWLHANTVTRRLLDPSPGVAGMSSIRKLKLLRLAFSCLDSGEGYLEIGTFQGKSLIAALEGNPPHPAFACDNFSEFTARNSEATLMKHLRRYGFDRKVTFFNADFRSVLDRQHIPIPIGLYLYDGAHDDQSQYDGIRCAEPLLADEALVIVDDWRFAPDSQSYAREATLRAATDSPHRWELLCELPARFNGDRALWWNGIGVLSFKRALGV